MRIRNSTIALLVALAVSFTVLPCQAADEGEQIVKTTCFACHQAGLMGSPQFGDAAMWAPRIAQGKETLYKHAIHGYRSMPAKGGNPKLTDKQVEEAVDYMVHAAGGYKK